MREATEFGAMNDLKKWLEKLGLGQHARIFSENDVDLSILLHLSEDDLKELGLSLGHRRKLLAALRDEAPALAAPAPAGRHSRTPSQVLKEMPSAGSSQ